MSTYNTFRDKRHLLFFVAITQLSTHLAIDLDLQKQQKYKGHRKVSLPKIASEMAIPQSPGEGIDARVVCNRPFYTKYNRMYVNKLSM